MKLLPRLAVAAAVASLAAMPALANDRYAARPPVVLSPDLSAPWVMQLRGAPGVRAVSRQQRGDGVQVIKRKVAQGRQRLEDLRRAERTPPGVRVDDVRTVAAISSRPANPAPRQLDEKFLPQEVAYSGGEAPGTIVIDTNARFLYLVGSDGTARRYGVGVGKPGFEWAGQHKVTRKAEWPGWTPPKEMIARERKKGRILPAHMKGGPQNPLGARAMYLGSTLYRIHGTNQPWTIGKAVSSGCIRMRNEDVTDLYERVSVGTKVIVM